ncbi:hypothetical protein D3C87_1418920 [compost metagenome]
MMITGEQSPRQTKAECTSCFYFFIKTHAVTVMVVSCMAHLRLRGFKLLKNKSTGGRNIDFSSRTFGDTAQQSGLHMRSIDFTVVVLYLPQSIRTFHDACSADFKIFMSIYRNIQHHTIWEMTKGIISIAHAGFTSKIKGRTKASFFHVQLLGKFLNILL